MFSDIHHVSYLVPDLDEAIESYGEMFGAVVTGRGTVDNLGEVAFLQVDGVEVEFIAPIDTAALENGNGAWIIHHVAYAGARPGPGSGGAPQSRLPLSYRGTLCQLYGLPSHLL